MKEKIMAVVTLGFIFSLFFYYKIINPVTDNISISSDINTSVLEHVNDKQNTNEAVKINSHSEIAIESENFEKNNCSLNKDETDLLEFSDAFKYYRSCNEDVFVWNNNIYTTMLKSEVENKIMITDNQENDISKMSIDKGHLKMQNELIGDNLK